MVEMSIWALVAQWTVFLSGMAVLGWSAMVNQLKAQALAQEVLNAHAWVDEIIEALENPPEDGPDERVDSLISERSTVLGSSADRHKDL